MSVSVGMIGMVFSATCFGVRPSTVETVKKCLAIFLDDNCDYRQEWGTEKKNLYTMLKLLMSTMQALLGGGGRNGTQHGALYCTSQARDSCMSVMGEK